MYSYVVNLLKRVLSSSGKTLSYLVNRTARESDAHTRELLAQLAKRDETLGSLNSRLEEKQRENAALARQLESALTETRHQVCYYMMYFVEYGPVESASQRRPAPRLLLASASAPADASAISTFDCRDCSELSDCCDFEEQPSRIEELCCASDISVARVLLSTILKLNSQVHQFIKLNTSTQHSIAYVYNTVMFLY